MHTSVADSPPFDIRKELVHCDWDYYATPLRYVLTRTEELAGLPFIRLVISGRP